MTSEHWRYIKQKRQEFIVRYCVSLLTTLTIVVMYANVVNNIH